MRKFVFIIGMLTLVGCRSVNVPEGFLYEEVQTSTFKLATWQKMSGKDDVFKIYIEGDGYSFDSYGRATLDPTPKIPMMRNIAFGDNNDNVAYIARPCQFVTDKLCNTRYWTSCRFSEEVVRSTAEAVKQLAGNNEVILVGFSGGAQIAGLVAVKNPDIKVKKIITIAGNLDHRRWTKHHRVPDLDGSECLEDYKKEFREIAQIHYVGEKDEVVPPYITYDFVANNHMVITVPKASHNEGFEKVYEEIWKVR